jgi:hypothetical protein
LNSAVLEALKAWWRGDKRVAPAGCRGRVYSRSGGGPMAAVAKFKPVLKMRVFRAATGQWEKVN